MTDARSNAKRWLVRAGLVAVAAGVALLLVADSPGGDGSTLAFVLGFATVVAGLLYAGQRYYSEGDGAAPPSTEPGIRVPVPGDDCDPTGEDAAARLAFKRRLSRLVVAALVEERGLDPGEAERRVAEGAWTDDPAAAAVLDDGGLDLPFLVRVRWRLRGRDPAAHSAERAVAAYEALREGQR